MVTLYFRLTAGYPDTCHNIFDIKSTTTDLSKIRYIRLNMGPDGGIARLKLYGKLCG